MKGAEFRALFLLVRYCTSDAKLVQRHTKTDLGFHRHLVCARYCSSRAHGPASR